LARSVSYIDRYDRAGFIETFPECASLADSFPSDILQADIARTDLTDLFGNESADFVILNHVLEHMVDPLRLLIQARSLLREGGLLYLAVPDKRFMFDRYRPRTRLDELIARHKARLVEPTDAMILDFIEQAEQPGQPLDLSLPADQARVKDHRRRSIHANVWVVEDLLELFEYLSRERLAAWSLADGIVTPTEVILLWRAAHSPQDWQTVDRVMSRIWFDSRSAAWGEEILPKLRQSEEWTLDLHDRVLRLDERARETQNFVQRIKRMLERVPWVKGWMATQSRPAARVPRSTTR
jgi:SAM-dependent methyltransferase